MKKFKYLEAINCMFVDEFPPNDRGEVRIKCVDHDDTNPSCDFNVKTGLFHCKSCGSSGNFMQLLNRYEKALQKQGKYTKNHFDKVKELAGLGHLRKTFLSYDSEEVSIIYVVEGEPRSENGISAFVQVISNCVPVYKDYVNLSKHKSRVSFANKLCEESGWSSVLIERDLQEIERLCSIKLDEISLSGEEVEANVFSEKELKRAERLLRNPKLIGVIKSDIKKVGLVGEMLNGLLIYLSCISRILDEPISIVVKGESSGGKSCLVGTITKLFPKSEIKEFTYISAKALMHMSQDLSHKVIVIVERHGSEASDYSVRTLQSEGMIRVATVEKNEKTSKHATVEKEVKGPVAFLETTTNPHLHPENQTRVFTIYIDCSQTQTGRIHVKQKEKYKPHSLDKAIDKDLIIRKHHAMSQLLKPYKVLIPFIDNINFPTGKPRYRRDFPRFLSLIEVSALIHQYQREKQVIDGVEVLLAHPDDYRLAYNIVVKFFIEDLHDVHPKSQTLLKFAKKFDSGFTRNDLVDISKWSLDDVKKYIRPLIEKGYFKELSGRKGQGYKYQIVKDLKVNLLTPAQLERKINQSKKK